MIQLFPNNLRKILVKSTYLPDSLNLEHLEGELQTSLENVSVSFIDRRVRLSVLYVGSDVVEHKPDVGIQIPVQPPSQVGFLTSLDISSIIQIQVR